MAEEGAIAAAPTIALLVPCFNAVPYLPRLRTQVDRLNPTFDQVLLVDDGSSDGTAECAEALGFNIIKLPQNTGPGAARNFLASLAETEWVHFHDVDDEIASDYITRIGVSHEYDMILHLVDFIDEIDRQLVIRWQTLESGLRESPAAELLRRPLPTMCSTLRRSFFAAVGGFDETRRCFEDADLHFRVAAAGARIKTVPEVLEWSLRHDRGAGADQRYCVECRVDYLEDYARSMPTDLHPLVAAEAERAAVAALRHRDRRTADRAIALAESLGASIPSSNNIAIRSARKILPAALLLQLQHIWRTRNIRAFSGDA